MDLYILDTLLRRTAIIDIYESLIWTDRFAANGDFELHIHSSQQNRDLLAEDTWVAIKGSKRVMVIETITDEEDTEGRPILNVSGRSLEAVLEDRVARHTMDNLNVSPRWPVYGTPGEIVRFIFKRICVDGLLDRRDVIPFIKAGSIFPVSTIPEPVDPIYMELEPETLYKTIKDICVTWGLGFALVRNMDKSELYFEVYTGSDRTTAQAALTPVIFSPELDSLTNVSELKSIEKYKNIAYVFAPEGTAIVYANGVDSETEGFKRKILYVKVDSVKQNDGEAPMPVSEILQQKGREALAEHRRVAAFDGEIPTYGYKYGVDYELGDIVEMRKDNGATNYMRVTEQIFISDAEGERSYPTLALDRFIAPGSWLSYGTEKWREANGVWADA